MSKIPKYGNFLKKTIDRKMERVPLSIQETQRHHQFRRKMHILAILRFERLEYPKTVIIRISRKTEIGFM